VLGQEMPCGDRVADRLQAVHPEGEVGVARGRPNRDGHGIVRSQHAVRRGGGHQAVLPDLLAGSRDKILERAERARSGAKGLIATWTVVFNGRDWAARAIPEKIDLRTSSAWRQGITAGLRARVAHPRRLPDLSVPNMAPRERPTFSRLRRVDADSAATGRPAWLREQWGGRS